MYYFSNSILISVVHSRAALQDHAQNHSEYYHFSGAFVLSHISCNFLYSRAQQLIRFHSISVVPPMTSLYFLSSIISICMAVTRFPTIAFHCPSLVPVYQQQKPIGTVFLLPPRSEPHRDFSWVNNFQVYDLAILTIYIFTTSRQIELPGFTYSFYLYFLL